MDKKLILLGLGIGAILLLQQSNRGTQGALTAYAPSSAGAAEFPQINLLPPGSLTPGTDPLLLVGLGYGLGQLSTSQTQQDQFLNAMQESNLKEGNAFDDFATDIDTFRLTGNEPYLTGRSASGAPQFFTPENAFALASAKARAANLASFENPDVLASRRGGSSRKSVPASFEKPFALANAKARAAGNASFEKKVFASFERRK